jgi:radical SAM superfamily enzyme YgiQ (UPF0313 family)
MDILFTHSYFLKFDSKQWKTMQPYPPLGTIYAAAVMREVGYRVGLFDPMFCERADEIEEVLKVSKPKYLIIYDDCFNYLTKMCLTKMREAAIRMAKLAKSFGVTVIICSSDSSDHYELYLQNDCDYVVIGEGEQTIKELIEGLENKTQDVIASLRGIARKDNDRIVLNERRPAITDLDALPFPAWDLVNVEEYKSRWTKKNGYFSLNMVTTRGCPYKCNWCAKPIYGNRYNSHSPSRIVSELELLLSKYQPDHIWFGDDIFGLKPEWVKEFADLVESKKLSFKFKIQSRVDLLLKGDVVRDLARAGCDMVWLGAESGSQKILDAMDKGIQTEEISRSRKLLKEYSIKAGFFIQFGYLDESLEDIQLTINMVRKLLPDEIGVSVSYPLPGTKFYEKVKSSLKDKKNWEDSDDLAMMFRHDQPKEYYKTLQRYLHKEFQKQWGFSSLRNIHQFYKFNKRDWRSILALGYYIPASQFYKSKFATYGN